MLMEEGRYYQQVCIEGAIQSNRRRNQKVQQGTATSLFSIRQQPPMPGQPALRIILLWKEVQV